jgi:hypothetical protein
MEARQEEGAKMIVMTKLQSFIKICKVTFLGTEPIDDFIILKPPS